MDVACLVPAGDWTGEGAIWKADEQSVYWVDLSRFLIHRLDLQAGCHRSWMFDSPPTALALTDRADTLVVALASRAILWMPATDERAEFSDHLVDWPEMRLNDGGAGPDGGFWVGSMRNNVASDGTHVDVEHSTAGALFQLGRSGSCKVVQSEIGIANTICWSAEADLFYFADTIKNKIWVFDYEASSGSISNRRPFLSGYERGLPDGSAVDQDGYLWNARYGGGCVIRIAPDGRVDRVVDMPVTNITTCCFGGADLRTLFVTTAHVVGGTPERLEGSLFSLGVDTPGLPEHCVHLS
jgi:sugar lactone lactonase YvrE